MEHDNTQTYDDQQFQPQQTCGLAVASLVLGIASIACLGIFAGLPAVICGIIALSKINNSKGSLTGKGLAIAGLATGCFGMIFATAVMAGFLLPTLGMARATARATACKSNLRQIGMAVYRYSDANNGQLPPDLKTLVDAETVTEMGIFVCPSDPAYDDDSDEWWYCSYESVLDLTDKILTEEILPSDAMLAWDSEPGRHRVPGRHPGGGRNAVFADRHVELLTEEEFQKRLAEVKEMLDQLE